jgi:hypothetical protein
MEEKQVKVVGDSQLQNNRCTSNTAGGVFVRSDLLPICSKSGHMCLAIASFPGSAARLLVSFPSVYGARRGNGQERRESSEDSDLIITIRLENRYESFPTLWSDPIAGLLSVRND